MKVLILILIFFLIIVFFRFVKLMNHKKNLNKKKDNVVDLEKDPKTDEYKPKE